MNQLLTEKHRFGFRLLTCLSLFWALASACLAQEAVIKKTIAERFPDWPAIDEVTKTPMPGVFEVRIGNHLMYADEQGNYLLKDGHLVDTKTGTSLTEERLSKLTAIAFSQLPIKDAMVWQEGKGSRKLAVFADPNCGACRVFEAQLQKIKDVTVYVFLMPILGPDSVKKSEQLWCAKDNGQAWLKWMLKGTPPVQAAGKCDASALERNHAFGQRHLINGTPAIIFEDGFRVPGAMPADQIEKQLVASAQKK